VVVTCTQVQNGLLQLVGHWAEGRVGGIETSTLDLKAGGVVAQPAGGGGGLVVPSP